MPGILKNPPSKTLTPCTEYPYGTVVINNTKYYTFIMRSTKNVYTVANTYWGKVAGGCRVACLTSLAGQEHQWYKGVNYVENTSGNWVQVTGDGKDYGFVDTEGYTLSSEFTKFSGKLSRADEVDKFYVQIFDKNQNMIYKEKIEISENWSLNKTALIYGYNKIILVLILNWKIII